MSDIWFTSDSHFGDANILTFTDSKTGLPIRPGFKDVEEMDEYMIDQWNSVVKEGDIVYHLGDCAFSATVLDCVMPRLKGRKRLILGNHDPAKPRLLGQYFQEVMVWRRFTEHDFVVTHIPLHESAMFKVGFNVHGHVHHNPSPSLRHINICVEKTNYTPLHLDHVKALIQLNRQLMEK